MSDLKELKRLAQAATKGDWQSKHHGVFVGAEAVCYVSLTTGHYESEEKNRDFIAAANPAAVLALIERVEQAERRADFRQKLLDAEKRERDALREKWEEAERRVRTRDKAFSDYVEQHGVEHADENCPEDDTCECPLVVALNATFRSAE